MTEQSAITCRNCGTQNGPEARFCSNCGVELAVACRVCGTTATPGAKFCSNCGSPLQEEAAAGFDSDIVRYVPEELLAKMQAARAGRAMAGERRNVTMLFADVKGSTAAAERLDPEDWADVMNGVFEHLIAPVYRFEGTLARLQGDAVLAFFGAPIAHEDDPVRALRAGLEITEAIEAYKPQVTREWGIDIDVRVGVNSGLVVVGEVGSDLRVEYTALGDAINVAARMEQTAEPGTVQVSADTLALTGGRFETERLGSVEVKGKAEPIVTHRVVRFLETAPAEVLGPIAGRDAELARLGELRSRLLGGTGSITSVIAEAGIGKSRLLQELLQSTIDLVPTARRFDDEGEVSWMFGASRSYDRSIPYSTIGGLLRRWWGTGDASDPFAIVTAATRGVGIDDPDAATYLAYMAGVPLPESSAAFIGSLETPALRGMAGAALRSYLQAEAENRPAYLVIEDLHWADDVSLALVDEIMGISERVPIAVVMAMRPYRDEPTWRIHELAQRDHPHRYQHFELTPLDSSASGELLESLLAGSAVGAEARRLILERSDGNPLFLEEIVRSMDDVSGVDIDSVLVPESLSGMLTARLDRLDDEARYMAQMASVLGSRFRRQTLGALVSEASTDAPLTDLLRRGILVESGRGVLAFRHALMQEAAYATILRRTRRQLHRKVADHLIERHQAEDGAAAPTTGSRRDVVQEIARHLVEAGDQQAAFPYLIEAGFLAMRSMALADTIRLFSSALDNVPEGADPELVVRALDGLGEAHSLVPDLSQSEATFQRLYDYGESISLPSAQVAALNRLAFASASLGGDLRTANKYLDDARRLAEECGDELGMAEYHMNACFVASLGGDVASAAAHDEATVEIGERQDIDWIRLSGLVRRATNYAALLDRDRALPAIDEALEAAREGGMEEAEAIVAFFGAAMLQLVGGDVRGGLEAAQAARVTLERYSSFYTATGQRMIGAMLYQLGDLEGALSHFVDARRAADQQGQPFVSGVAAAGMALVYATVAMHEPIRGLRQQVMDMFAAPLGEFLGSSAWADLGYASLLLDDPQQAEEEFRRGLASPSITYQVERVRLTCGLAQALAALGDEEGAAAALGEAQEFAEDHAVVFTEGLFAYTQGELAFRRGLLDDAEASLVAALQAAMERGEVLLQLWIHTLRSKVAAAMGDDAAHHRQSANTTIDTIAASIADEALRDGFVTHWQTLVTT